MRHMALRVSVLYALFAALWILFSDRALVGLVSDPVVIGRLSTYKGWAFVTVTGLLLYGTLRTQSRRWHQEMSARIEAERGLRESEERYRVAVERSQDGVVLVRDDKPIFVNGRFLDIFGYDTAQEVLGKPLLMTVHPDDHEMVAQYISKGMAGELAPTVYECRGITRGGTTKWIEVSVGGVTYLGEPAGLICLRDITERKKAEEELRTSQVQFAEAADMARIAYWEYDEATARYVFNDGFYETLWHDGRPGGGLRDVEGGVHQEVRPSRRPGGVGTEGPGE